MDLAASWSRGVHRLLPASQGGWPSHRSCMRCALRPRCQQGTAMHAGPPLKQQVCHAARSARVLLPRQDAEPRAQGLPPPPSLNSFQQQELPLHSRLLHGAHMHASFALDTAAEQAEAFIYQVPIWLHALVSGLTEVLGQSMARLEALVSFHMESVVAPAAAHTPHHLLPTGQLAAQPGMVHQQLAVSGPAFPPSVSSPGQQTGRQMLCSVSTSAWPVAPATAALPWGLTQKVGLVLAGLLLALLLPRLWKRHWEEVERARQIQQLVEMNAVNLQRQKQRFHQALQVDSINLELPDIKDVPVVDLSKAAVLAVQRNSDAMREQWESFMATSKIGQVKDVWDAHEQPDTGAPRATKQQLEAMTARVRAANSGADTVQRRYVSFEELCGECDDFDAGMANRVAQRKARFQGQFLTDADVGLPSAPKRAVPLSSSGSASGTAPGNGRLARTSDASRSDGLAVGPRKRVVRDEGAQLRPGVSSSVGDAGPSSAPSAPLLNIRPRQVAHARQGAAGAASEPSPAAASRSSHGTAAAESSDEESGSAVWPRSLTIGATTPPGPSGAAGTVKMMKGGQRGADVLTTTASNKPSKLDSPVDAGDARLQQSQLLRPPLHHVHPPPSSHASASAARQADAAPPATRGRAAEAAAHAEMEADCMEAAAAASAGPGQDDLGEACYAPVSGVSVGLLRGASRLRMGTERARTRGPQAQEHDTIRPDVQRRDAAEPLAHLMRRPAAGDPPTRQ